MHASTLIIAFAAMAAASPLRREAASSNSFEITNFVYGCTVTCDWSFDVVDANSNGEAHPGFSTPVHCSGTKGGDGFDSSSCGPVNDLEQVAAYITSDDVLSLQYRVNVPSQGATYWYDGNKTVGAATGYNPSPSTFCVPESKAYAVA